MFTRRTVRAVLGMILLLAAAGLAQATAPAPIPFTQETLPNGLQVIYAPLHQAPVVHVRVFYHVGSRDERPDRQGFAHMFEHMMFRGSEHVAPEEHMKLIGIVGGYSNAYTSFDETVYVNTVPANQLELALYLEADRMASFKVSDEIFQTERKVVAEEWRMRQNQPYGTVFEDFVEAAFTRHSYRWTPIGDMEHLRAATSAELQEFFNRYYVPNNAVLVVAGDFRPEQARQMVQRYFGWIPRGEDVRRDIPAEPEQTEPRRREIGRPVPLPMVMVGYRIPEYRSDDHYALSLLTTILGHGRSSRLDSRLVYGEDPKCMRTSASHMQSEDPMLVAFSGVPLAGRMVEDVEGAILEILAEVVENGVTAEELDKAKTLQRVSIIRGRETAASLAGQLASEAVFGGDPNRVNTDLAKLEAVTVEDIQRVARTYLRPESSTILTVRPDREAMAAKAAEQPNLTGETPVAPSSEPVAARNVEFPADWPSRAPIAADTIGATFEKGVESQIDGVKVIVMEDHRLPLVSWSLTMRGGSHNDPAGKEGLGGLTASMMRRGAAGLSFGELNEDLESRGISIYVSDGGDYVRLGGSSTSDQLAHGILRSRQVLHEPTFPAEEFEKLKAQTISQLKVAFESPTTVAGNEMTHALYGDSSLGRITTPETVAAVTLDDVKAFYRTVYRPGGTIFVISGDVTPEQGREMAARLLEGWPHGEPPAADYTLPEAPAKRRIILVDRPEGQQATIRMGIRAYTNRSDDKFPGAVASRILSSGIDSRLGRYVRAEKGLAYGVWGVFSPGRQAGDFVAGTDTSLETTAEAVEAIFKVFDDMRRQDVTPEELSEAKTRVAGGMVMGMQTIEQQAGYRVEGILNGYPLDYYDVYPTRINAVAAGQVREVMDRYVKDDRMVVVVVAPAEKVQAQLEALGEVEVVPMPAERTKVAAQPAASRPAESPASQPAPRELRPAA